MARKKPGKASLSIDFSKIEERSLPPEGPARLKVLEATLEDGDAAPYIKWKFEILENADGDEGGTIYNNTSLAPNALWNLKRQLDAMGYDTDTEIDLSDPSQFEGEEVHGVIVHQDWNGTTQARIGTFIPEDEVPAPTTKSKGGKRAAVVEDDDEDDEEEEEAPKTRKRGRPAAAASGKRRRAAPVEDDDDEDEEEEEEKPRGRRARRAVEEDDEDEKPVRKSASKVNGKKRAAAAEDEDIDRMDEKQLRDYAEDNELEIDFDNLRTLKAMRRAVNKEATEAGLV